MNYLLPSIEALPSYQPFYFKGLVRGGDVTDSSEFERGSGRLSLGILDLPFCLHTNLHEHAKKL
jgi:hypothetical protein